MNKEIENLKKIEEIEHIREKYISIIGYEKDIIHTLNYKIDELREEI